MTGNNSYECMSMEAQRLLFCWASGVSGGLKLNISQIDNGACVPPCHLRAFINVLGMNMNMNLFKLEATAAEFSIR